MGLPRPFAASAVLLLSALVMQPGCKKEAPTQGQTLRFSKVPLNVEIPAGWSQTLNTADWLMYRPDKGGALLAMSGEKSCSTVEKRVYGALLEIGLTEVVWKGSPRETQINGLRATVAEGEGIDARQRSRVKYAVVQAPERRGCLLALIAIWQSEESSLGKVADSVIQSVHSED